MIAALDLADLGATRTVRTLLRRPAPGSVPGLRWADAAVLAQFASSRPPRLRRAALFAFWDDEDAADEFAATHPAGQRFAGGAIAEQQRKDFHKQSAFVRFAPMSATGSLAGPNGLSASTLPF